MEDLQILDDVSTEIVEQLEMQTQMKMQVKDLGKTISSNRKKVKKHFNKLFRELFVNDIKWIEDARWSSYKRTETLDEHWCTYTLVSDHHELHDILHKIKNSWGAYFSSVSKHVSISWREESDYHQGEQIRISFRGSKSNITKALKRLDFNIVGETQTENNITRINYF